MKPIKKLELGVVQVESQTGNRPGALTEEHVKQLLCLNSLFLFFSLP